MKLRIRSLDSKETLKIETPSSSSLPDLKDAIAQKLSAPPETLHLSLNRKDEIEAAPHESLSSLGIASGDLIYYTVDPNGFSGRTPQLQAPIPQEVMSPEVQTQETPEQPQEETASSSDAMDEDLDDIPIGNSSSSSSVPCFLRKVLREEVISPEEDQKLLIIAVHAVFLETGYVGYNKIEQQKIDGFRLPLGWASKLSSLSLQYTVPSLLGSRCDNGIESVVLKFQVMGKYLNVHGSLSRNGVSLYRLCLDKSGFAPSIGFVQTNCEDGDLKSGHEKGIFEFWKIVKDGLALPLLIDLCVKTGLEPPPCFICLPTDLKLKILELLPGVDIARISCVSSELRFIASHNDLWKQKFTEEFPASNVDGIKRDSWKDKFIVCWERKMSKRRERARRRQRLYIRPGIEPIPFPRGRPRPAPFGFPRIIGDYDLFPAPFGSRRPRNFPARRNFTPPCDLDGFHF